MNPFLVADELVDAIREYLHTTFGFAEPDVDRSLDALLEASETGMFRGPYVSLRLPYRGVEAGWENPLELAPPFAPYAHQLAAWRLLGSRAPGPARHALITTGTGSGKSECFLYPLLDHCYRHRGIRGIKALILYPMNALASDQARRLAEVVHDSAELSSNVSVGMYVGEAPGDEGAGRTMQPTSVITDRNTLRDHPPDVLLTNYRMLDLLLQRPEDQRLWAAPPGTLRYLVLDEVHTYDGAQGTDVACLIRRLRARLGVEAGTLACVGTSATLGGGDAHESAQRLRHFAEKLFGESFPAEAVVTEAREGLESLRPGPEAPDPPEPPGPSAALDPQPAETAAAYARRQAALWFPATPTPPGSSALDPEALGARLLAHPFTSEILQHTSGAPLPLESLIERLGRRSYELREHAHGDQRRLLVSYLSLLAWARRPGGRPLLQIRVQLLVRELSRLARPVQTEPALFWRDDRPVDEPPRALVPVHCRACGAAAWLGLQRPEDTGEPLVDDFRSLYRAFTQRSPDLAYVYRGDPPGGQGLLHGSYLDPESLRLLPEAVPRRDAPRVFVHRDITEETGKRGRDKKSCPRCETSWTMGIVGSRGASLLSVLVGQLFATPRNDDRKLLVFTDSVQDAAHRAGYLGARTYRFQLRAAFQSALRAHIASGAGGLPLDRLAEATLDARIHELGMPKALAALLPPDLGDHPSAAEFMAAPATTRPDALRADLLQRLRWEAISEFGLFGRFGRSLEKVGSAAVALNPERLAAASRQLHQELTEEHAPLAGLDPGAVRRFVWGVLTRSRHRGGIDHPLLRTYLKTCGKGYMLSKQKQPLLPGFPRGARRPTFLTDGRATEFDVVLTSPGQRSWFRDWAQRTLGPALDDSMAQDAYRGLLRVALDAGLVSMVEDDRGKGVYPLRPDALLLTTDTCALRAEGEATALMVAAHEAPWLEGAPALAYQATSRYQQVEAPSGRYYRDLYDADAGTRIQAAEHSGLLQRPDRERLEDEFKRGEGPRPTNLLACTPTLEMGIDVGDLSATVLASVPPRVASYLQRIGRAGRRTGNALVVTMARGRPHDLYFYRQPEKLLAGSIDPPGCFLDAPEVLLRHLFAFVLDCWAADPEAGAKVPSRLADMLRDFDEGGYPLRALAWAEPQREALLQRFLEAFAGAVQPPTAAWLQERFLAAELEARTTTSVQRTQLRRKDLRLRLDRVKARVARLEAEPDQGDATKNEMAEFRRERAQLRHALKELDRQYPLAYLAAEGLLPNYAFPEAGVKLTARILADRKDKDGRYPPAETYEVPRPAASAIVELAPGNLVYALGRKVQVSELDTGGGDGRDLESWRFCDRCPHQEPETPKTPKATCPACGSAGWGDGGQVRPVLPLREVRAQARASESKLDASADEREPAAYACHGFLEDLGEGRREARARGDGTFGYEYLGRARLRTINFGPVGQIGQQAKLGGMAVPEKGFKVCADCGVVPLRGPPGSLRHRPSCKRKDQGEAALTSVLLSRQVRVEALRILPPLDGPDEDAQVATFRAALALGLREWLGGEAAHLEVQVHQVPQRVGSAFLRPLVAVVDTVPGGTGMLRELARGQDQGEGLHRLLSGALGRLQRCPCAGEDDARACYRCLYAYRLERDMQHLDRSLAIRMIERALADWGELAAVESLEAVAPDPGADTELERRFRDRLLTAVTRRFQATTRTLSRDGQMVTEMDWGPHRWVMSRQVSMEEAGVFCQPDYLLRYEGQTPGVLPVAVFADGFEPHAKPGRPHADLMDDFAKRRALIETGRYRVWSLSWHDLPEAADTAARGHGGPVTAAAVPALLRKLQGASPALDAAQLVLGGPFESLLAYLQTPSPEPWGKLAQAWAASFLMRPQPTRSDAAVQAAAAALAGEVPEAGHTDSDLAPPRLPALGEPAEGPAARIETARHGLLRALIWAPLGALLSDGRGIQGLLWLDDRAAARGAEGYLDAWRAFLAETTLLQFLPEVVWTTACGRVTLPGPLPEAPTGPASTTDLSPEARALAEDPSLPPGLSPVFALLEAAGLPLPVLGLDPEDPATGGGLPVLELAWEAARIGVLAPQEGGERAELEAAGWSVFEVDAVVADPQALVAALAAWKERDP